MDFLTPSFFYGRGKTNENDLPQKLNSDLGVEDNDKHDNVRVMNEGVTKAVRESRKRKRSGTMGQIESISQSEKIDSGITCAQEINQEPSSYTVKKFFKNSTPCRESNRYYRRFCSSQKFRAKSKLGSELFKRISQAHRPLSESEIYVEDNSNEENNAIYSSIDVGEHQTKGSSSDSSEEIHGPANGIDVYLL